MKKLSVFVFLFCSVAFVTAQTKIVTGHPDFKVQVTRCAASGTNVVLDMVFTNLSETDVEDWSIHNALFGSFTTVYDSEGNLYDYYRDNTGILFKVGNSEYRTVFRNMKMISDVPVKVSMLIKGVPETVESLARVDIVVVIPFFNIGSNPVKIKNIPISR